MLGAGDGRARRGPVEVWLVACGSVFVQNGGFGGVAWNIATFAAVAAFTDWFWGAPLTLACSSRGILLPEQIDKLWVQASHNTGPRNFAGSSGATCFLGATLAAALLLRGGADENAGDTGARAATTKAGRGQAVRTNHLLALGVPALGLVMWFAQDNGHGRVAGYGFALGALAWAASGPHQRGRPSRPHHWLCHAAPTAVLTIARALCPPTGRFQTAAIKFHTGPPVHRSTGPPVHRSTGPPVLLSVRP
ncbi:hypothetical protein [Streptomyces sp. YS-3]|uniref:hypothetical protein n=1 Tax=Streptomyces sp. YS-3 TaxID=3381352 RepID=UPI003862B872